MANSTYEEWDETVVYPILENRKIDLLYVPYELITKLLLLTFLILIKILGHLSITVIIDPKKGTIFANIIWFLCQLIISWINDLFIYISLSQFVLIQLIL